MSLSDFLVWYKPNLTLQSSTIIANNLVLANAEVLNAHNRIVLYPEAWHPCSRRTTRRYRLHSFSYGNVYQIRANEMFVIAIANLHKKPDYWIKRI